MLSAYFGEKGQLKSKRRAKRVWSILVMKMRSDNTAALQGLPTGSFPDWFFIPNKRQKASRPVATGIGGGQLWGRAGLWRSYVLHRIWGCYLRLPTSVSISEHVKLVIRRLCLCSFHLFEPVPGSENLPAGRAGSLLWSVGLLQAVCSLCTIFCSLFCLCLHLMYIYSQRSGASAGN